MIEALTNLDKSTWGKHRFDEIAMMVSERIDPNNTDLEIYVGLEHLDSESLHIRSHGTPDDVNGTKLRFYEGDVIFGRRRAYQRKAAIAEYDGFCSAHAMVLRAKPDVIDPALFPFFLHSDQFMHRAVDISVGSLSPTINWKTLRKQEFLLPPKPEQARLAELLWAGDAVLEGLERVVSNATKQSNSLFNESLYKHTEKKSFVPSKRQSHYPIKRLGAVLKKTEYGVSFSMEEKGHVPILRMNAIQDGQVVLEDLKYYTPIGNELDKLMLSRNDVLFNRTNSFELVGKVGLYQHDTECSFASYLIRLVPKPSLLDNRYLARYLNSFVGAAFVRMYRTPGVNQSNINTKNLARVLIPIPPLKMQQGLMDKIDQLEDARHEAKATMISTRALQKSLINQIF